MFRILPLKIILRWSTGPSLSLTLESKFEAHSSPINLPEYFTPSMFVQESCEETNQEMRVDVRRISQGSRVKVRKEGAKD